MQSVKKYFLIILEYFLAGVIAIPALFVLKKSEMYIYYLENIWEAIPPDSIFSRPDFFLPSSCVLHCCWNYKYFLFLLLFFGIALFEKNCRAHKNNIRKVFLSITLVTLYVFTVFFVNRIVRISVAGAVYFDGEAAQYAKVLNDVNMGMKIFPSRQASEDSR